MTQPGALTTACVTTPTLICWILFLTTDFTDFFLIRRCRALRGEYGLPVTR